MLVSSETSFRYLEPIRQAGVIAILPKPFNQEQLKAAFESALDYMDPGELENRQFSAEELKVLVVDDSQTARRHIIRVLRNMGIEDITQVRSIAWEDNFDEYARRDHAARILTAVVRGGRRGPSGAASAGGFGGRRPGRPSSALR